MPSSIDRTCFSINRTSCFRFFKNSSLTDSNTFSKVFFQTFLSLSDLARQHKAFCRFLPKFLQGFPPSRPIRRFYPSFCSYFHVFMHFFMHLKGIFGLFYSWDFLLIQCYFFEIDHWVLLVYCYIHDCCWLI